MTSDIGARQVRTYLEECGSSCPYCRLDVFVRRNDRAQIVDAPDAKPQLLVPCHCPVCRKNWIETYRLNGIHEGAEASKEQRP